MPKTNRYKMTRRKRTLKRKNSKKHNNKQRGGDNYVWYLISMYNNNKPPLKISITNTNTSYSLLGSNELNESEAAKLFFIWLNATTLDKPRTNTNVLSEYFTGKENPFWFSNEHSSFCERGKGTKSNPFTVQFVE
jgi:hypothetical protein